MENGLYVKISLCQISFQEIGSNLSFVFESSDEMSREVISEFSNVKCCYHQRVAFSACVDCFPHFVHYAMAGTSHERQRDDVSDDEVMVGFVFKA